MEFYRNKKKSVNLILICSGIFLVFIVVFLYAIGIFDQVVSAKLAAISGIGALVLAIVVIKMLISLKDTSALLTLSQEGISSKVTSVSKAAGLILWKDIIDMNLNKVGADTLITLTVDKPAHYIPIIRKKLSAIAVDGIEDANGNLPIHLTASALDMEAPELFAVITKYREGIKS
jgi:hypothetical protein